MPATFVCPNPVCGQALSQDSVKGAASVKCPKCGTVFQFRSQPAAPVPAPATQLGSRAKGPVAQTQMGPRPRTAPAQTQVGPRPQGPAATPPPRPVPAAVTPPAVPTPPPLPTAPPPLAAPVTEVPLATPVAAEQAQTDLNFASGPTTVGPTGRRRGSGRREPSWTRFIVPTLGLLALGAVAGGAVWGAIWLFNQFQAIHTTAEVPEIKDLARFNCRYALPEGTWKPNSTAVTRMVVNFSLTRGKPNNNMALFCRDYTHRLPSEAEMFDTALTKLRGHFNPLEWERVEKSTVKLGGQPVALHLEFQGTDNDNVTMNGEVLVLGYRGFGYWFCTWCPLDQKETLAPEWSKLRANFSLLDGRAGWKETPRPRDTLDVPGLPYEVPFVKEVWGVQLPEKWDPNARAVLVGHDPTQFKHSGKAASFCLIVLEKAPGVKEAFDLARKYHLEREKAAYPDTIVTPTKTKAGKDQISLSDIGNERGYLGKFHVRNTEALERFQVLAALQGQENTLLLLCDCDLAQRAFWETEFAELIKAFKKKKE